MIESAVMFFAALGCFWTAYAISRLRLRRLTHEARMFRVLGTHAGPILWNGFPANWREQQRTR